uniref:Uncharacterized protein n=1 Tax=Coccidioides posadasii RMSCC 3488 TaxID=454284 RepID=A0A0J6FLE7_COCPO|nr:hypothetical protein CPAG_05993 [Coccidioides posadasii RMSCC 3488]
MSDPVTLLIPNPPRNLAYYKTPGGPFSQVNSVFLLPEYRILGLLIKNPLQLAGYSRRINLTDQKDDDDDDDDKPFRIPIDTYRLRFPPTKKIPTPLQNSPAASEIIPALDHALFFMYGSTEYMTPGSADSLPIKMELSTSAPARCQLAAIKQQYVNSADSHPKAHRVWPCRSHRKKTKLVSTFFNFSNLGTGGGGSQVHAHANRGSSGGTASQIIVIPERLALFRWNPGDWRRTMTAWPMEVIIIAS